MYRNALRALRQKRKFASDAEYRDLQIQFAIEHGLRFLCGGHRVPLMVPAVFSLHSNRDAVVELITNLRQSVLLARKRVFLHFDKVIELEPSAALLLVAEIDRCLQLRRYRSGKSVSGNYPANAEIYAQLVEMGFYRLIKVQADENAPHGALRPGRPVFLPFRSLKKVQPGLAATFVELVEKHAIALNPLARVRMVAALKEAMGNAHEHAYKAPAEFPTLIHRWWLAGHIDPERREMMVLILDQGVGIPNTLEPTYIERARALRKLSLTPTDGELIRAATEVFRTSTGNDGRGRGFRDMQKLINVCDDGELRVSSNRGSYRYAKASEEGIADHDTSIGGTLIQWRISHASVAEINDG